MIGNSYYFPERQRRPHAGCAAGGFTLVELLAVMAIIGALSFSAAMAYNNVGDSRKMAAALSDLSSLVELAKTQAMSRNTYVRVGFLNSNPSGSYQLIAGAVASKDGSTSVIAANLYPISKLLKINGVKMVDRADLSDPLKSRVETTITPPISIASTTNGVSFSVGSGPTMTIFSGSTITFTPQGEVMIDNPISDTPYIQILELGVRATKGTVVPATGGQGLVWVYGASAQTRVFK